MMHKLGGFTGKCEAGEKGRLAQGDRSPAIQYESGERVAVSAEVAVVWLPLRFLA